ncbi:MAG: hypothetical protein ACE5J9_00395 [Methanosarcinales archaeon]
MTQKAQTGKSYLVFISHSKKDRWIAKQIATLITPYKAMDLNSFDEYLEQLFNRVKEAGK